MVFFQGFVSQGHASFHPAHSWVLRVLLGHSAPLALKALRIGRGKGVGRDPSSSAGARAAPVVVQDGTDSIARSSGDGTHESEPKDSNAPSAGNGISGSQPAAPPDAPHVVGTGDTKDVTGHVLICFKKLCQQNITFHKMS